MRPSLLLRATHYTPRIKFLRQKWKEPQQPHAPHAHPMAPPEIADSFQSFLAKLQSSSTSADSPSSNPKGQNPNDSSKGVVDRSTESGSGSSKEGDKEAGWKGPPGKPADFENFWEAPKGLWKAREWSEREIEAIMSGGATDIRSGP